MGCVSIDFYNLSEMTQIIYETVSMKKSSNQFLIGNDRNKIALLKKLLIERGLTEKHFIESKGQTYLNLEGTLLTCELEENRYYGDNNHFYRLSFKGQEIADSNHKDASYDRYTILLLSENIESLLPENLIDEEYVKQQALEKLKKEAKESFIIRHTELFKEAKSGFLGFFRNTKHNPDWSLKEIIEHGMAHDNRTRQVCVEMGWLTKTGGLSKNAPDFVKEEVRLDLSSKLTKV